ncbi:anti-sigma factor family protein, partial [Rhodopirellula bahusiensis]
MSLKPEQIDQLISDHLDGRLSDDQSQWLAEQLRMDADLAQRITDAEFDRQMLRSLHQSTTTSSSLPSDFASRVVAAAQQRAIDDELSSDHPLRKLPVSVPVESVIPQSSRNARRTWVAAIAGLAAAGLLVASLQNGLSDPDPNNPIG